MSIANPFIHNKKSNSDIDANNRLKYMATIASVSVASILITIKLFAYLATDSVSVLSSLMDSTIDILASIITFLSVKHAMEPADKQHRYGHGKLEALSAMGQAMFIFGSAIFLSYETLHRFIHSQDIRQAEIGYVVMTVSILLTLALVIFQKYVVKKTASIAIDADHLHYKSDLFMNLGVILAIFLTSYTGWKYFDPIFSAIIVLILLRGAKNVGLSAYDVLMDRELSEDERKKIISLVKNHKKVDNIHDLRTRNTGQQVFIEFHLEMKGSLSLKEAHDITEEIETIIYQNFKNAEVLIHQEPTGIMDDRLDKRIC